MELKYPLTLLILTGTRWLRNPLRNMGESSVNGAPPAYTEEEWEGGESNPQPHEEWSLEDQMVNLRTTQYASSKFKQ